MTKISIYIYTVASLLLICGNFIPSQATNLTNAKKTAEWNTNVFHPPSDTLPFPPDSIYTRISQSSEVLLEDQELPKSITIDQWYEDLDHLDKLIKEKIPYFESAYGSKVLQARLDSLKKLIPEQTRDQRILSVFRLANLPAPGTAHTDITETQRVFGWRAFPVWTYPFDDGTYIMSADDEHLIEKELLQIEGTPIETVYKKLGPYENSENRWNRKYQPPFFHLLNYANPLQAVGIIDDLEKISITVENRLGEIEHHEIDTYPLHSEEFLRFISSPKKRPEVPENLMWSPASTAQDFSPNSVKPYMVNYHESSELLHIKLNAIVNESDRGISDLSFADLTDSVKTILDEQPVEKTVLDLRTNYGGNSTLIEPLVKLLGTHPKTDQRGKLYTLTSPITYSAAGLLAMAMERRTKSLFGIGPSGFAPNIWGEAAPYLLPNSKITVKLSYAYYQAGMPNDPRSFIEPDLQIPFTSRQHFQNVDSALTAIEKHLADNPVTVTIEDQALNSLQGNYRISPVLIAHIEKEGDNLLLNVYREGLEPFISSDLRPLSNKKFATDISNVFIKRLGEGNDLTLVWKDTTYTMQKLQGSAKTPNQLINEGKFDEGVKALKKARDDGELLSTELVEYPFTNKTYQLIEREHYSQAKEHAKTAIAFMPMSWRSHLALANVYEATNEIELAIQKYQKAISLNAGSNFTQQIKEHIQDLKSNQK